MTAHASQPIPLSMPVPRERDTGRAGTPTRPLGADGTTELVDTHGRIARDLRVSLTDRCNLRCTYCRSGMETFIPHESVLRYEEMEQLVDMAMGMGVEKVRLTGGEPTVRRGVCTLVGRIAAVLGVETIGMTTNGLLL